MRLSGRDAVPTRHRQTSRHGHGGVPIDVLTRPIGMPLLGLRPQVPENTWPTSSFARYCSVPDTDCAPGAGPQRSQTRAGVALLARPSASSTGLAPAGIDTSGVQGPVSPEAGVPVADRRAAHPVARLTREFDDLCRSAVDPLEIAAGLESAGWNDIRVRAVTGLPDVFALGNEMFALVPCRASSARGTNPWPEQPWKHLLRGLIFTLPGLLFHAVGVRVSSLTESLMLIGGLILGWSVSQAMSYAALMAIGWARPERAAALMRTALLSALGLLVVVPFLLGVLTELSPPVLGLAAAIPVYTIAASVLLIRGQDLVLAAILLVGGLGGQVGGALAGSAVSVPVATGTLAVLMVLAFRQAGSGPWRGAWEALTAQGWRPAQHGLWGMLSALLVLAGMLAAPADTAVASLVLLALWMGPAEWVLQRLRRSSWDMLHRQTTSQRFRRRIRWQVTNLSALWAFSLAGATFVVDLMVGSDVSTSGKAALLVSSLGIGLVCGLMSVALDHIVVATWLCVGPLVLAWAAIGVGRPEYVTYAAMALAVGQFVAALRHVARASSHL